MFSKVLVANRGEIALRIIRTLREWDIASVAVYSEADADAVHVRFADEAVCIGPAQSQKSYLNMASIISAAEITSAEAIHPGYGFLSESPAFAELCKQCNLTWIGPEPETMRLLGDKVSARNHAISVGVPVLPGSGAIQGIDELHEVIEKIGLPAIIKASGGGGGRGMKVVNDLASAESLFQAASREASSSFQSADMFVERYCPSPRHIEVQIVGAKGQPCVSLGVRDCSIQRRHQKILEESPPVGVPPKLLKEVENAATTLCDSLDYDGIGTVEFLLQDGEFFFIEVNPRLQVEHPVTEAVTGIDLVECQLRIAAGEKLDLTGVQARGYSIELRINAEDSIKFAPSCGEVTGMNVPGGIGVRVDTHVHVGYVVPPYYDSLLAKLIVTDRTREAAIARAKRALKEFVIEGPKTNIDFFRAFLSHPPYVEGDFNTRTLMDFLEK